MVASDCLASVDICMMRVTGLTSTGFTQPGLFGYATDSVELAKIGTTNDTINEVLRRNGCGSIVTRVPQQVAVKGSSVSIDVTKWERDLIQLMCGGDTIIAPGGHTGGYTAATLADGPPNPVCIEMWSKAWDGTVPAVTAQSTPNPSYHCWVMPFVRCSLSSQFQVALGDTVWTITGEGSENPNMAADGPFDDWPTWVANAGGFTSSFGEYDSSVLPVSTCGLISVPAGS